MICQKGSAPLKIHSKKYNEKLFIQYRPMIEGAAWKAAKVFRLIKDVDDIISQAYLIFAEASARYDSSKASFSTFLYSRLRTINDYCIMELRRKPICSTDELEDIFEGNCETNANLRDDPNHRLMFESYNLNYELYFNKFIVSNSKIGTVDCLSASAQQVVNYMVERVWEIPGVATVRPTQKSVYRWFNYLYDWSSPYTRLVWEEVKEWWEAQ